MSHRTEDLPPLTGFGKVVTGVACSPAGQLAATSDDGTLRLWDLSGLSPGRPGA